MLEWLSCYGQYGNVYVGVTKAKQTNRDPLKVDPVMGPKGVRDRGSFGQAYGRTQLMNARGEHTQLGEFY